MRSCVTKLPLLAVLATTDGILRNADEYLIDGSIASTPRVRRSYYPMELFFNTCHLPLVLVLSGSG